MYATLNNSRFHFPDRVAADPPATRFTQTLPNPSTNYTPGNLLPQQGVNSPETPAGDSGPRRPTLRKTETRTLSEPDKFTKRSSPGFLWRPSISRPTAKPSHLPSSSLLDVGCGENQGHQWRCTKMPKLAGDPGTGAEVQLRLSTRRQQHSRALRYV